MGGRSKGRGSTRPAPRRDDESTCAGPARSAHTSHAGQLDHIVICPAGVFVVDAKQYKGRPHLRVDGGFFVPRTEKLMVGSRDCNKLVDGVLKQVALVRTSVGDETVPVRGFLCFVAADWPLFGGSFTTRGVTALWPKKLAGVIAEPGRLVEDEIRALHDRLAEAFPIA